MRSISFYTSNFKCIGLNDFDTKVDNFYITHGSRIDEIDDGGYFAGMYSVNSIINKRNRLFKRVTLKEFVNFGNDDKMIIKSGFRKNMSPW